MTKNPEIEADIAKTDDYAPREVLARYSADGTIVLKSCVPLSGVESNIVNYLEHWAQERPDRVFLAQRTPDRQWDTITYAGAWHRVQGIAQGLINAGHRDSQMIAILSPASIEHGLLMLAGMLIGAPIVPVSPAYSLIPEARPRLVDIARLIEPSFVFVQAEAPFAEALKLPELTSATLISAAGGAASTAIADWYDLTATDEVWQRRSTITGDTIAKILFTSGSTGKPKGVVNTQSMLCHAVSSTSLLVPESPDGTVYVDWMPWHHTMAGNAVLHGTLRGGGTLYLDDGKPMPGAFEKTIENLRDGRPTVLQTVPATYSLLANAMERDDDFRIAFFSRMERLIYAGASLPMDVWHKMQALAVKTRGKEIDFGSALGTTETGPGITVTHWASKGQGELGLPVAGAEIKLLPVEDKYEIRVRGPNVTPGYFGQPELTRAAFDEEGFYRTGDLVDLVDKTNPAMGLRFAGRLSENFKLSSGSWVATGELRLAILEACSPFVSELVLAGVDQDDIRALIWPQAGKDYSDAKVFAETIQCITSRLSEFNRAHNGATHRIAAFRILLDPPSMGAGEITDKGNVNQRSILANRSTLVDELYAPTQHSAVFLIPS